MVTRNSYAENLLEFCGNLFKNKKYSIPTVWILYYLFKNEIECEFYVGLHLVLVYFYFIDLKI